MEINTLRRKSRAIFNLTPRAAEKVQELMAQEGAPDAALRLEVQPGGCAGFRYGMFFEAEFAEDDIVQTSEGVKVVCDPMSAPYLEGVMIDWGARLITPFSTSVSISNGGSRNRSCRKRIASTSDRHILAISWYE
jgi:iron-sulfur cluster assembly accessory protein